MHQRSETPRPAAVPQRQTNDSSRRHVGRVNLQEVPLNPGYFNGAVERRRGNRTVHAALQRFFRSYRGRLPLVGQMYENGVRALSLQCASMFSVLCLGCRVLFVVKKISTPGAKSFNLRPLKDLLLIAKENGLDMDYAVVTNNASNTAAALRPS